MDIAYLYYSLDCLADLIASESSTIIIIVKPQPELPYTEKLVPGIVTILVGVVNLLLDDWLAYKA